MYIIEFSSRYRLTRAKLICIRELNKFNIRSDYKNWEFFRPKNLIAGQDKVYERRGGGVDIWVMLVLPLKMSSHFPPLIFHETQR